MLSRIIRYIIRFIPVFISTAVVFVSLFSENPKTLESDMTEQIERISALEAAYASGEMPPVNEADFFSGNLQAELESGIKFNEMIFLATHNSYQTPNTQQTKELYRNLSDLTFGLLSPKLGDFFSPTLTEQLNTGLRSFEIDIEVFDRDGEVSFTCMHNPYIEMTTSCYDFELAMKELAMWSDNNPNHLPITIIIETKEFFIPLENMKAMGMDYMGEFEDVLRRSLGNKLFTPSDMLRDYESFGAMRRADDWCKVSDMLGKVLVLLHETGITEDYIKTDPSIKTQVMFPMLREKDIERDCASFIIANKPDKLVKNSDDIIKSKKLIVRTRADEFTNINPQRLENALASGAQIVSTDYPYRKDMAKDEYFVSFGGYTTVKAAK